MNVKADEATKAAEKEATTIARLDAQDARLINDAQAKVREYEHEEDEINNRLEQLADDKAFQLRVIDERQAIMAGRVKG